MTTKNSKKVTRRKEIRELKSKQMQDMLTLYSQEAQLGLNYPLVGVVNNNGYSHLTPEMMEDSFTEYIRALKKRNKPRKSVAKISARTGDFLALINQWRVQHDKMRIPKPKEKPSKIYTNLPMWRDASDELKALYLQRALDKEERGIPFNLNLGPELRDRAQRDKKGMVDYLHRHLSRHLKRGFGQTVDFWIVVELSTEKNWHVHGTLDLKDSESTREGVKAILRKASGVRDKGFLSRAVKLSCYKEHREKGSRWCQYLSKDFERTRKVLGKPSAHSATIILQRRAKILFEEERLIINSFLGRFK